MTKMDGVLNGVVPARPNAKAVCDPKTAKFKRYVEYTTTLTQSQIDTLAAASSEKTEASIVLSLDQLRGKHTLSLTKQQYLAS
jgi:bifunctional ADP-heptose synthase (sugar kinase/adenylyltransferase)